MLFLSITLEAYAPLILVVIMVHMFCWSIKINRIRYLHDLTIQLEFF